MSKTCEKCMHYDVCRYPLEYRAFPNTCWKYEEERPHGEWLEVGYSEDYRDAKYKCSKCETEYKYTDFINIDPIECFPNFCPNCGADMRVKEELNRVSKELNSEIEKSKSEIIPDYRDGWRLRGGEEE